MSAINEHLSFVRKLNEKQIFETQKIFQDSKYEDANNCKIDIKITFTLHLAKETNMRVVILSYNNLSEWLLETYLLEY